MSSLCTSNVTSGFIDLATFDELEKYMYGGSDATAYFVRDTRKSTWFTQVPVCLSRASGEIKFDSDFSVTISRAGDYLLHTWLRVVLPEVAFTAPKKGCWTKNLMHNLVEEACITFNDLVAARFDSYHLDFWAAFTTPAGKRNGYNNMIGNLDELNVTAASTLPSKILNLPLPFFFSRDSGVALPTAALPYNDMRITFKLRKDSELLLKVNALGNALEDAVPGTDYELGTQSLQGQVWANYAIVSNDERKRMACAPRDILIEQVQTASRATLATTEKSYDVRFSHAIKALFFAARNVSIKNVWSNYTVGSPSVSSNDFVDWTLGDDPIEKTSIIYENTTRLSQMGSDYYSLVNPYYHAPSIPLETGYHVYSYSLDLCCLDPMGSTNYGKLTNVSIVTTPSSNVEENKYQLLVTAVNNNIIRISGGALGFPVL